MTFQVFCLIILSSDPKLTKSAKIDPQDEVVSMMVWSGLVWSGHCKTQILGKKIGGSILIVTIKRFQWKGVGGQLTLINQTFLCSREKLSKVVGRVWGINMKFALVSITNID